MRKGYVAMIGGTLLVAALLGGLGTLIAPRGSVSPGSANDGATASSGGSASEQAAALEAAEEEARENPVAPPPTPVMQEAPEQSQAAVAPSSYEGSVPMPSVQFADPQADTTEGSPELPVTEEE